jgi:pantetheine-phosphate adenylyltransferase
MFDKLIVAVLDNSSKHPSFSVDERVLLIKEAVSSFSNVSVSSFNGLLVDFAKEQGATFIVKGLRAVSDFEYEFQMALINNELDNNLETVFLATNAKYMFLSSSVVKEVAKHGGDIRGFVPSVVKDKVNLRLNGGKK